MCTEYPWAPGMLGTSNGSVPEAPAKGARRPTANVAASPCFGMRNNNAAMSFAPCPGPDRSVHSRMKAPNEGWAASELNCSSACWGAVDWDANSVAVIGPLVGPGGATA